MLIFACFTPNFSITWFVWQTTYTSVDRSHGVVRDQKVSAKCIERNSLSPNRCKIDPNTQTLSCIHSAPGTITELSPLCFIPYIMRISRHLKSHKRNRRSVSFYNSASIYCTNYSCFVLFVVVVFCNRFIAKIVFWGCIIRYIPRTIRLLPVEA